jgi:hypothetical protein
LSFLCQFKPTDGTSKFQGFRRKQMAKSFLLLGLKIVA